MPDPWPNAQPDVYSAPIKGLRSDDSYRATCYQCRGWIAQTDESCPDCEHPVQWRGSAAWNKMQNAKKRRETDNKARARRAAAEADMHPACAYALRWARLTSPMPATVFLNPDEQQIISTHADATSNVIIMRAVDIFVQSGDKGRGLIRHLCNALIYHGDPTALLPAQEQSVTAPASISSSVSEILQGLLEEEKT